MLSTGVLYVLAAVVFDGVPHLTDIDINIYLYIDDLYSESSLYSYCILPYLDGTTGQCEPSPP